MNANTKEGGFLQDFLIQVKGQAVGLIPVSLAIQQKAIRKQVRAGRSMCRIRRLRIPRREQKIEVT